MAELDKNDHALTDYFLRGMRRFKNHVHTQNADEPRGRIFGRVEIAARGQKPSFNGNCNKKQPRHKERLNDRWSTSYSSQRGCPSHQRRVEKLSRP